MNLIPIPIPWLILLPFPWESHSLPHSRAHPHLWYFYAAGGRHAEHEWAVNSAVHVHSDVRLRRRQQRRNFRTGAQRRHVAVHQRRDFPLVYVPAC